VTGRRPADPTRRIWIPLCVVAVAAATALLGGDHARSWHYFTDAGRGLFDPGLYRAHPELQFGPAAAGIARGFLVVPGGLDVWAVMAVGSLAGVLTWRAITQAAGWPEPPGRELRLGVVGLALLVPWVRLAGYTAHPDDVVALTATASAVWALTRRRWGWATVLVALAVAVKPWAVVVTPILLGDRVPHSWRRVAGVAGVVTLSWLPYLTAPGTIGALTGFGITVDPNSGLRALGLLDATTPGWLRPVQLGLGVAAAIVAARRSGPAMVPLAGIAVRLALDPATHQYYTAGFVVAGLLAELSAPGARWPWKTALAAVVLEVAAYDVTLGGIMPSLRLGTLGLAVLLACRVRTSDVEETPDALPSGDGRKTAIAGDPRQFLCPLSCSLEDRPTLISPRSAGLQSVDVASRPSARGPLPTTPRLPPAGRRHPSTAEGPGRGWQS
jgi:hypothetical protein